MRISKYTFYVAAWVLSCFFSSSAFVIFSLPVFRSFLLTKFLPIKFRLLLKGLLISLVTVTTLLVKTCLCCGWGKLSCAGTFRKCDLPYSALSQVPDKRHGIIDDIQFLFLILLLLFYIYPICIHSTVPDRFLGSPCLIPNGDGGNMPKRETSHSFQSSANVKNDGSISALP